MRVTMDDVRKAGFCARGARRWFEAQDLDFPAFLKHGMAAQDLLATGDGQAEAVVRRAEDREAARG